jgi:hypothetical protein
MLIRDAHASKVTPATNPDCQLIKLSLLVESNAPLSTYRGCHRPTHICHTRTCFAGTTNVDLVMCHHGRWTVSDALRRFGAQEISLDHVWRLLVDAERAGELLTAYVGDLDADTANATAINGLHERHSYSITEVSWWQQHVPFRIRAQNVSASFPGDECTAHHIIRRLLIRNTGSMSYAMREC